MTHSPSTPGCFPAIRLRRLRRTPWIREMVQEHRLSPHNLIYPLFVQDGKDTSTAITSLPGVHRLTIDRLVVEAKKTADAGIPAIALFPYTDQSLKTPQGEEAHNPNNLVCRAIKEVKNAIPEIGIICDVALDPYTSHGHDGIVIDGDVANDATVEALCRQAVTQAKAGCDIIAPSDMMDGRVGAIRQALDTNGFSHVSILSYAAKYASSFYGPFREAVGSVHNLGKADKRTYQMHPGNTDEAMREVAQDLHEGADMVMVKPGMPYLDIIRRVRDTFNIPVFAYQVSGEYAMLQLAGKQGLFDPNHAMMECLLGFKRAGATGIFTYAALDVAHMLND